MCCCQNTPLHTDTVQFVMYVQCAQHYCNTKCVAVRTHRYTPTHYNFLCTFSVHNISVTHNVLLSEHTVTHRHSTVCYVRSGNTQGAPRKRGRHYISIRRLALNGPSVLWTAKLRISDSRAEQLVQTSNQ